MNKKEIDPQQVYKSQLELLKQMGNMTSGVIHDINNPIAIITGQASIIQARLKKEEIPLDKIEASLDKIFKALDRVAVGFEQLRSFYNMKDSDDQLINAKALLSQLKYFCYTTANRKEVDFSIDEPSDEISIKGKYINTFLALKDCIYFAIRNTSPKSIINISCTKSEESIKILIKYSSDQIDKNTAEKVHINEISAESEIFFPMTVIRNSGGGLKLSQKNGIFELLVTLPSS